MIKLRLPLLLTSLIALSSVCHADTIDDPFATNKDYANLLQKAQNGDHQAQFKLGLMHVCAPLYPTEQQDITPYSPPSPPNFTKALQWLLAQPTTNPNIQAQFDLGFIYYFFSNTVKNTNSCNSFEEDIGYNLPNLNVDREFTGENGKKFVLLNAERLEHSIKSNQYYVLYLVPHKSKKTFSMQALSDFGDSNDSVKCLSMDGENLGEDTLSPIFLIKNEDQKNVAITFNYIHENCKTKTNRYESITYTFNGEKFIKEKTENGIK